jgi:hypothetical protein
VKSSFTPKARTAEGDILNGIINLANSNDEHGWVLDHLPEVLHYEALPADATDVQTRLSESKYLSLKRDKNEISYENRVQLTPS